MIKSKLQSLKNIFIFERKNVIAGTALAVIISCAGFYLGGALKLSIVLAIALTVLMSVRLNLSEKLTAAADFTLLALTPFAVIFLSQYVTGLSFMFMGIQKLLLGAMCIYAVLAVLYAVTLSCKISSVMCTALFSLLITVNYFVYSFKGVEFSPNDILSAATALGVANGYAFSVNNRLVYSWIFAIIYISLVMCFPKHKATKRLISRVISAVISAALIVSFPVLSADIKPECFSRVGSAANGYILNFSLQLRDLFQKKPDNYSISNIKKAEQKYKADNQKAPGDQADIIVIMNEAFADLSVVGSTPKTNIEATPFINSIHKNAIKGYALSSVFGGDTANSEYEFLTGNTMAYLPTETVPYNQFMRSNSYSLVNILKSRGYYCIGTHPYLSRGWNRRSVYPYYLGFDESHFLEDYPQNQLTRGYVSDSEMFEQITKKYEQRDKSKNFFLFGVTMQNHGGYTYSENDFKNTISLQGYSQPYPDAEQYLSLINETDKAVEYLISYFEKIDKKVTIVFYGDHLPNLNPSFYEELHGGKFDTLEKEMLKYKVPFFIWANYDIPEKEVECTSLNFLSNYLYQAAGMELPPYNKFLADVNSKIPAMNSHGYYSEERGCFLPYDEAKGEEKDILNLYAQLQYNNIFDSRNRSDILFPIFKSE